MTAFELAWLIVRTVLWIIAMIMGALFVLMAIFILVQCVKYFIVQNREDKDDGTSSSAKK